MSEAIDELTAMRAATAEANERLLDARIKLALLHAGERLGKQIRIGDEDVDELARLVPRDGFVFNDRGEPLNVLEIVDVTVSAHPEIIGRCAPNPAGLTARYEQARLEARVARPHRMTTNQLAAPSRREPRIH